MLNIHTIYIFFNNLKQNDVNIGILDLDLKTKGTTYYFCILVIYFFYLFV